jgi:hypothetical protein
MKYYCLISLRVGFPQDVSFVHPPCGGSFLETHHLSSFFKPDANTQRKAAQYKSSQKLPQNGTQWAGRV